MSRAQPAPILLPAPEPDHPNQALLVFLHGFDDDAESYTSLAAHLQTTHPHLSILLPTAPHDHGSMSRAWFAPRPFSVVPVGRSSAPASAAAAEGTDEEKESPEDDVAGIARTCAYLRAEIAAAVAAQGIRRGRVVVAGFSQGGAVSLALGLGVGREGEAGEAEATPLAGVACLSGYLPAFKVPMLAFAAGEAGQEEGRGTRFFLAHGTRDMLVPGWVARMTQERVRELVGEGRVRAEMYQRMGHVVRGEEVRDFGEWLESVVGA